MLKSPLPTSLFLGAILVTAATTPQIARAATIESVELRGSGGEALCLDVAGGVAANGTELILHPCHGGANQSFVFHRTTGEIRSTLGDLCVDVDRGEARSGNRVQLWSCNGSAAQRFEYDPRSRRIAYRSDRSLCVDLPSIGASARLRTCADRARQRFTVTTPYGNDRFDELTFLTGHNAYANYEDSRWSAPNQSRGIGRALRDGVRGFMLDAHSFESDTARCIFSFGSDCYDRDVYLCHGSCTGFPGIGYALPRQTLSGTLRTIVEFLASHPDEIVTVFLEDYVARDALRGALDDVPGLRDVLFDPYAWNVRQNGWPRASDMVDYDARLLLFSDRSDKRELGVGFAQDFTVENYWSIGDLGNDYECRSRWDGIPLDQSDAGFQRLFVMNQFRNVPTVMTAAIDNGYSNLMTRIEQHCVPAAGRKPNFIAVDFYEKGDARGVVAEVDDASAILFQHSGFRGRAQLLGAGSYAAMDLRLGNDAVSSLRVAPGTSVVLFEHDQRRGSSMSALASMGFVGDFNDRTSSLIVRRDPASPLQHRRFDGDFDGDGRSDQLVYYAGTGDLFYGRSSAAGLAWSSGGNLSGFGNLLDGRHALHDGDFDGDGATDLLFYFNGDGNWWLGRYDGASFAWNLASNTAGLGNLLGSAYSRYTGDFDGNGATDVMFYYADNGDWWMGLSSGDHLDWHRAGNTSGFGDLLAHDREVYTGDFDGDGATDVMFYYAGNGDWWMGLSDGDQLDWHRAGNTSGFGDLLAADRAVYTGDFDGDGRTDVSFYYAGNGDWWTGRSDGNELHWRHAGNTAGFGNLLDRTRSIHVDDFDGDGRTDVAFHYAGNGDWWFGRAGGDGFVWTRAGNSSSFGDLLDPSRIVSFGDHDGDGRTDVMLYSGRDGTWTVGRSSGSALGWSQAANTAHLGDFTR